MPHDGLLVGNRRRLIGLFYDVDGVPSNPSDVKCRVRKPDGSVQIYLITDVTNDQPGRWHIDVNLDQGGAWTFRWEGTGTMTTAEEETFIVESSRVI